MKREISLSSASALIVANMVGTGVFTTSGVLLADLRSPWAVLLVWLLGGVIAALGALSYGALARRFPESGGEYLFLSHTLHPAAGYVAGWISLLVGFSAPLALSAFAFGEYTKEWFGIPPKWAGTLLLVLFSAAHSFRVRTGAFLQNLTVLVKVIVIIGFTALALPRLDSEGAAPLSDAPMSAFGVALVLVSFSYSGWNAAVYVASEVKDPQRNLPRSLLLGTGLVTLLYLGLNTVFVFAVPPEELSEEVAIGRIAATALGGSAWGEAVTVLIAVALITSVSAMVMAGPRVYAKMAADGYLPRSLAPDDGPPRGAIAFQLLIALILLWSAAFDQLLTYVGFTLGLSTAATVVGLLLLRRREGKVIRIPGWPWIPVPILFLLGVLWMTGFTVLERPGDSAVGLGVIAVGIVAWWWSRRRPFGSGPSNPTEAD